MSGALPSDQSKTTAHFPASSRASVQVELEWNGPIKVQTTHFIMEWMENRLDQLDSPGLLKKRMVRVAVELLQNMHHHAAIGQESAKFEVRSVNGTHWLLVSKNALSSDKAEALRQTWQDLKAMCSEELRTMQRDKIAGEQRSAHGGGGVGLNEILRKAAGHVTMEINHQANDAYVTFTAEIPIR